MNLKIINFFISFKGVKCYFNAAVDLLHFPLVCLVDYMGYRLGNQKKQFN